MTANPRVVIIGGGMAGMGAAHELKKQGVGHLLLEASPRVGGRVLTEAVDGFRIDAGANLFLDSYGTVLETARELGVAVTRSREPLNGGIYRDGRIHGLEGGQSPKSRYRNARTFLPFRLLSPKGTLQAAKLARTLRAKAKDLSFDDHEALTRVGIEGNAAGYIRANYGPELLDRLVQPILSCYTLGHPEDTGAAHALAALWHLGLNVKARPCLPEKGIGEFTEALFRHIKESVRTATPVERIDLREGRVCGVTTAGGEFIAAEAVICATTATAALRIAPGLAAETAQALQEVTYSKCCRVVFGTKGDPLPPGQQGIAFPRQEDRLVAGVSAPATLLPALTPPGRGMLHAFVIGDQAGRLLPVENGEIVRQVATELETFLPKLSDNVLFSRVYRWPEAVCLAPGAMTKAMPRVNRHNQGNNQGLLFAGEYLGGIPSANGALRSGINAAREYAAKTGASGRRGD